MLHPHLTRVDGQPVLEPNEFAVRVEAAQMEWVVARKVVAAVSRANSVEARLDGNAKCLGRKVFVFAIGKGKVSNIGVRSTASIASFEPTISSTNSSRDKICAKVRVAARVCADLDACCCQFAQVGQRIDSQRLAGCDVVRK